MSQEYRNIYKIAREAAGMTQERAAEYLDVSIESVKAYEGDKRLPPDEIVVTMVEVYDARFLAYQHMKGKATADCLPEIKETGFTSATMKMLKEINDLTPLIPTIIEIAENGKVDENELRQWFGRIEKEIGELSGALIAVILAAKQSISREK